MAPPVKLLCAHGDEFLFFSYFHEPVYRGFKLTGKHIIGIDAKSSRLPSLIRRLLPQSFRFVSVSSKLLAKPEIFNPIFIETFLKIILAEVGISPRDRKGPDIDKASNIIFLKEGKEFFDSSV